MAPIVGLIIGFLMCIPVGPINIWVINTQLKKGQGSALAIAAGGSFMDLIYFYIILSGLSIIHFPSSVVFYTKIAGLFIIFSLGVKELLVRPEFKEKLKNKESPGDFLAAFAIGVIIYTSNPTLIITMTGLGAFVKSLQLFTLGQLNIALVSIGLATGSFLWFFVLIKLVSRYREKIQNKYLFHFSKVSGLLMIALSFVLSYQLYIRNQP